MIGRQKMIMTSLEGFKAEFSDRKGIHFNSAGASPISRSVSEKVQTLAQQLQHQGSFVDPEWIANFHSARARLAEFLGADVSEVAYVPNCGSALSIAAFGFPLTNRDEVVTVDQEYASNFYPWREACTRSGAKFTVVPSDENKTLDLDLLLRSIRPGVKLVGISWVQFQTGAVADLVTLGNHCHEVGAYLVVDGIQGIGQLPFSFCDLPVDFVCGASHKWMCSINGQGYLAVKKPFLDFLRPPLVGCGTFNRYGTFADPDAVPEASARKFEPGGLSYFGIFALDSAIQVHQAAGLPAIAAEISRLSRKFREGLLHADVHGLELVSRLEQPGGITSFRLPADKEAAFLKRCQEQKIMIVKRGEFVRASIHAFCSDDEVDGVLETLRTV